MSTVITAHDISVEVKGATLLRNVDFRAASGELVAIIGPNGAGKSTLMSVLAGDRVPTGGRVTMIGDDIRELDVRELAARRAVFSGTRSGAVPFTVREVVEMGRHVAGNTDEGLVSGAMIAMDVARFGSRVVSSLSGGERTRVDLARILVQDTPVVILDEPLATLDVAHEERVMTHLRGLTRRSRSVIAVLHDLNAAAAYADRVIVLNNGAVAAEGVVSDVFRSDILSHVYEFPMTVASVGDRLVVVPARPHG